MMLRFARSRLFTLTVVGMLAAGTAACSGPSGSAEPTGQSSEPASTSPASSSTAGASAGSSTAALNLQGRELFIANWGGSQTEAEKSAIADPFSAETGAKVTFVDNASGPEALAYLQEQSGNVNLDIAIGAGPRLAIPGYLAEFPPELVAVFNEYLRPGSFSSNIVEEGLAGGVIVCNPAIMAKCPTNPAEFWNVKDFPGPRAIMNDGGEMTLLLALEAAGVPKDQLHPIDIDAAIESLKKIRPDVQVWTESGSQQEQVLLDKEVGAAIMWNGRAHIVKRDHLPDLQISWDGCIQSGEGGYTVLRDAPNKDVAFAYLEWMAKHPEAQAKWVEAMTYTMPGKDVLSLVPTDIAEALPTAKDCVQMDNTWLTQNSDKVQKAWQEFFAS